MSGRTLYPIAPICSLFDRLSNTTPDGLDLTPPFDVSKASKYDSFGNISSYILILIAPYNRIFFMPRIPPTLSTSTCVICHCQISACQSNFSTFRIAVPPRPRHDTSFLYRQLLVLVAMGSHLYLSGLYQYLPAHFQLRQVNTHSFPLLTRIDVNPSL